MGFTVVRLPFSNEMLTVAEVPPGAIDYALNPELLGRSPLEVRIVWGASEGRWLSRSHGWGPCEHLSHY
jgi:hypothetical protein